MTTPLADLTTADGGQSLSPKTLKALEANDPAIVTVGDLAEWQREKGQFWAKDIPGIGDVAHEEIEDALTAFYQAFNEQHPETKEEADQEN